MTFSGVASKDALIDAHRNAMYFMEGFCRNGNVRLETNPSVDLPDAHDFTSRL